MTPAKATHQKTKQHNRDLVLKTIFEHESISRADIARLTKLTRATVSDMVASLIDEGLVEEIGYGESIGGKAPILLSLVADSRYLIGLNLAQDKFIGAVVNLRGEIKETAEIPIENSDGEQALQFVYQILDQLTQKDWQPLVGIGIGTPGLVNTQDGNVVNAVNLDWQDLPLAHLVESRYHIPVSVLNDSQATAIGEFVYGVGHSSESNLIVVTIKYGIGSGILINGRLFQGDGGGAGEIGHVVVQENGSLCRCGKYGCLETVASTRAILQRATALAPEYNNSLLAKAPGNITISAIEAACQADDPLAQRVVSEAARYLGTSLANLISVLNIQKIVLTGDMACFGDFWLQSVREAMMQSALTRMAQDTVLEVGTLDFKACILGASAFMLLENYSLLFTQTAD
ncbi:MAG: ROK family transcriptional regulator [Anaerolineales bacterium]|nr:ROK family transcriptional regulator [Anaerolineales bacterium]